MTHVKKTTGFIQVVFTAIVGAATLAYGQQHPKLSTDLPGGRAAANMNVTSNTSPVDVDVIVQYKTTPTNAHHEKVGKLGGKLHIIDI